MFMDRKILYGHNVSSYQLYLEIQHNFNQNSSKLFYVYQQTDSEVYTETQNSQ